jgi:Flp pilus assembly protein TadG
MQLKQGFGIMFVKINNAVDRLRTTIARLSGDNRGVAAIEFAMIAPLLITLYLGTLEISGALQMNKKVGRAASMTGDLIAQFETSQVNKANIEAVLRIGKAVTQPYALTQPKIILTGINIDATGKATISWSRQVDNTTYSRPFTPGTVVTVPAKVKIPNTFLVKSEAQLEYRTLTSWSVAQASGQSFGKIDMAETYYLRPRVSDVLSCSDC